MPTRDLSHPIEPGTWTYPGDPPVSVEPHATIDADGYRVSALSLGSHTGTHLDAPGHTEPEGATVDDLPVESFAFDAVIARLDVDARESISTNHLRPILTDAELLVLDTGWAAHWGADRYLDHPYLSAEAAAWCAERGLSVAIDAPSVDPSPSIDGPLPSMDDSSSSLDDPLPSRDDQPTKQSADDGRPAAHGGEPDGHPAHHAILGAGLVIVENLTGLDGLPERFELRAYPLPLAGADGTPVRAVAVS